MRRGFGRAFGHRAQGSAGHADLEGNTSPSVAPQLSAITPNSYKQNGPTIGADRVPNPQGLGGPPPAWRMGVALPVRCVVGQGMSSSMLMCFGSRILAAKEAVLQRNTL